MSWNTAKQNLEISVSNINLNVDELEAFTSGAEIFGGQTASELVLTVSELKLIEVDTDNIVLYTSGAEIFAGQTVSESLFTVSELRLIETDTDNIVLYTSGAEIFTGQTASELVLTISNLQLLDVDTGNIVIYTSGAEIFTSQTASELVLTVSELRLIETDTTAMTADLNELTAAPVAKLLTVVTRAITTSGTSLALTAAETFARKAYLNARRANAANSNYVYIGNSDVDYSTNQQMALAPGDAIVIDDGPGTKFDLNKVYLDATKNNDGITGFYFPV